ncbi:uncharacterized protein LOC118198937 [Stegodyphus dumicola]|uniref:uncharacterized protein LOC118198937 n=1 Tax=Stegodyphus dumicola TaxID=202533 RepID=UPI0015AC5EF3|nr:uncharacterized protein LOC118198937 [Stegodyphus dumicola]
MVFKSKLTIAEIFVLTYDVLEKIATSKIMKEYGFGSNTMASWSQCIRETILEYIEMNSQMIGGPGKTVEIDESKFGKKKYHRSHHVEGQWVFGGVERDSGDSFFVAVHDGTAQTLISVIQEWIRPGTTIITDCWRAYRSLDTLGFDHLTVNHSISFVDEITGAHTNTIEGTWRHIKTQLPQYNRNGDFVCI